MGTHKRLFTHVVSPRFPRVLIIAGSVSIKCRTTLCTSLCHDFCSAGYDVLVWGLRNRNRSETKTFRCLARLNATGNLLVYKLLSWCISRLQSSVDVFNPSCVVSHFKGSLEGPPDDPYTIIVSNMASQMKWLKCRHTSRNDDTCCSA